MKRPLVWVLGFVMCVLPPQLVGQASGAGDSVVVLRAGDAVRITVWRQPELSGEFNISADGGIDHPLYQSVRIVGVPLRHARESLREFLTGWEADPQFVLRPLFRVAVGGEVQRPNLYVFPPEITIAQAVASAGGVTDRGRIDQVRVLRADGSELTVDLTRSDDTLAGTTVHSGDQIFVRRSPMVTFREYIAPAGTLAMAAVTLVSLLVR